MDLGCEEDPMPIWPMAIIFGFGAGISFTTAMFPQWQVHWGGNKGWHRRDRIPMSVAGRVAGGVFFAYGSIWMIFGGARSNLFWMAGYVLLMIGVFFIGLRDKRKYLAGKREYRTA
jgi:hypothetical protein